MQTHSNGTVAAATLNGGTAAHTHLYFPAVEGFGETYRRVMLNQFFSDLLDRARIQTVAELPLDDYGVVGAGSVIFAQRGCHVRLVADDRSLLVDGMKVFEHNRLQRAVTLVQAPLTALPVPDNSYDLGWNFDRLLTLPSPPDFLREMARVCKAVFVCVPNAHNYGQYAHYVYHKLRGDRCAYVEPRAWMARRPVRETLKQLGLEVVNEGLIDVPWWPGFPELPDPACLASGWATARCGSSRCRPPAWPKNSSGWTKWPVRLSSSAQGCQRSSGSSSRTTCTCWL
jgi:hypothetical protein